jgi:hypothetical protein
MYTRTLKQEQAKTSSLARALHACLHILKKTKNKKEKNVLAKSSVSYFRFTYKEIERAAREETWH